MVDLNNLVMSTTDKDYRRLDLVRWHIRKDFMTTEEYQELVDLLIEQVNDVRANEDLLYKKIKKRNRLVQDLRANLHKLYGFACEYINPEKVNQVVKL